ncbi:MAG: hypothetical protein ACQGVC_08970 [Myxococcota bacterium]
MAERTAYLRGANLGMSVAIAIVMGGGALLLLGPGASHTGGLRAELARMRADAASWQARQRAFRPAHDGERAAWTDAWRRALSRIPAIPNDPELVAAVSDAFDAPSVRGLHVETRRERPEADEEAAIEIASPLDGTRISLRPVPLSLAFNASFRDAAEILGRVEARQVPARVEALRMRRDYPDVEVAMELTYFVRGEEKR